MNSKLKKIGIVFGVVLLFLLMGNYIPKALALEIGDHVAISGTNSADKMEQYGDRHLNNASSHFFCIESGMPLNSGGTEYAGTHLVENKHYLNAETKEDFIMAYIGSKPNAQMNHSYKIADPLHASIEELRKKYSDKQRSVYYYFPKWQPTVGWEYTTTGSEYYGYSAWVTEAENIWNKVEIAKNTSISFVDKDTNKIKSELYNYNGEEYVKVGPFAIDYYFTRDNGVTATTTFTFTNQNGNTFPVLYGQYDANGQLVVYGDDAAKVQSDEKQFYVLYKNIYNITEFNFKVEMSGTYPIYTGEICILTNWTPTDTTERQQSIIHLLGKGESKDYSASDSFTGIPIPKDLTIEKKDADSGTLLNNVGFVLYNVDKGQWVSGTSSTQMASYSSNRDDAKVFITGKDGTNGKITVKNLYLGTYRIYETINPNAGYENPTSDKLMATIEVNGQKLTYEIENDRILGDLSVKKVDEETQQLLNGVGFVIYNRTKGQYVRTNGSTANGTPATYTSNRSQAKVFITGTDGSKGYISVSGLEYGNYTVYEVSNTDYRYEAISSDKNVGQVTIDSLQGSGLVVENEMKYLDMSIYKLDKDTKKPLSGVKFVLYNVTKRQYVKSASSTDDVRATYTTSRSQAQEFTTNSSGKITARGLEFGTYRFYEVENPDYEYAAIVNDTNVAEVQFSRQQTSFTVYNEKKYGDLQILKIDKDTKAPLNNVKFVIYNVDKGQYVRSASSTQEVQATYTATRSQAQVFTTNSSGKIYVKGLEFGNYRIYETNNPHYEYEAVVDDKNVATVAFGKDEQLVTIPNEPVNGDLEILKVDSDTYDPLDKVSFVVYNVDKKQYVQTASSTSNVRATYTSTRSQAKVFTTDSKGRIYIKGLTFGNYRIYETNNPHYEYEAIVNDKNVATVKFTTDEQSVTIPNDKTNGDMEILKVDSETKDPIDRMGFVIYNVDKKQYVQTASSTQEVRATYTSNRNQAKEFITDSKGRIFIKGLAFGKYIIYETSNPHYEYEAIVSDKNMATVTFSKTRKSFTIQNEMKYGDLEISKRDEETHKPLNNVGFVIYNVDKKQYVRTASSTQEVRATYTSNRSQAKEFITGKDGGTGKVFIKGLEFGNYIIYESSNDNIGYEVIVNDKNVATVKFTRHNNKVTIDNRLLYGSLEINKKDQDSNKPLNNVGFVIYNVDKKQYVRSASSTDDRVIATFTSNRNQAKEFITGRDGGQGKITIRGLEFGKYIVYESSNANYGYEVIVSDKNMGTVQFTRHNKTATLTNRRKYVKISGYVWEDIDWQVGKFYDSNNLYEAINDDKNDQLVRNVTVRLKDRSGNTLKEVRTNANGKYTLVDVELDKLNQYYIEFAYNGMAYESVSIVNINNNRGTKAIEGNNRTTFNANFAQIQPGQSNSSSGRKVYDIEYNTEDYKSTIDYEGNYLYGYSDSTAQSIARYTGVSAEEYKTYYPVSGVASKYLITSTTYNAYRSITNGGYSGYLTDIIDAAEIRKKGIEEIGETFTEGINLGIKKRERPDLSVVKDVESAKVSIVGTQHVYRYGDRFNEELMAEENGVTSGHDLDPKVKFEEKYAEMTYTRPLYASDVYYTGGNGDPLAVELTYKISVRNNSTGLNATIYELDDYFDAKYSLIAVGTDINDDGSIKAGTEITNHSSVTNVNSEYKKFTIGGSNRAILQIGAGEERFIYVQLQVIRNNIVEIVEDENTEHAKLDNITEIRKYAITKTNNGREEIYAGIDKDSQPGNVNVNDRTTWEDDTDKAPGLLLVLQQAREVNGKVFIDEDENAVDDGQRVHTAVERQGNGHYDDGESGVENVKVSLVDTSGNVVQVYNETTGRFEDAVTYTDSNGNYTLDGFIPGEYEVQYTWGGNVDGAGLNSTYTLNGEEEVVDVQNYKSTVVNRNVWNAKGTEDKWYNDTFKRRYSGLEWNSSTNREIRASDAVDDYQTRLDIDSETGVITNAEKQKLENTYNSEATGDKYTNAQMNSNTQSFKVFLEYDDTENSSNITDDGVSANRVTSIDFGIIERARQILQLDKHITSARVTLANGNVLINAKLENGVLVDQTQYVTVLPPSPGANGQLKIEVDTELLQSARVEIEYGLEVTNISELEYQTQDFYMYGKGYGETANRLVTLQPSLIIDYLDNSLATDMTENAIWDTIAQGDRKSQLIDTGLLSESLEDTLEGTSRVITTDEIASQVLVPVGLEAGSASGQSSVEVNLKGYKLLSSEGDETFVENYAEIIRVIKNNGGGTLVTTPGNYIPTDSSTSEEDNSTSESLVILPPTGLTTNYTSYIILAISSLLILGVGIILIKKKVNE